MNKVLSFFGCLLVSVMLLSVTCYGQCSVGIYTGYNSTNIVPTVFGCAGSDNLNMHTITSGGSFSYQWQYKSTISGTFSNITGATSNSYTASAGGYFRVIATSSTSCIAVSDSEQAIIFSALPVSISAASTTMCGGGDVPICVSVNGSNDTWYRYQFQWYKNGSPLYIQDTVSCYHATSVGSYYCEVSDDHGTTHCTSTTPTVTIAANPISPAPTVTSTINYCQGATPSALTATGTSLQWYGSATTPYWSSAPTVSTVSIGSTTYWVSQNVGGCTSPRASITVNVAPVPAAPTDSGFTVTYCQNAVAIPLSAVGSNLMWYTTGTGGTGAATAPTPSTASAGITNYWASQTVSGCEGPRKKDTVNVKALPITPTGSGPAAVCPGDTIFLSASSTVMPAHFSWTGPASFHDTLPAPYKPNATVADSGLYKVTISASGCISNPASVLVKVSCPDSVWAGDANYDNFVDNTDVLQIALCFGSTGPARAGASTVWQAQDCNKWSATQPGYPTVNRKHADCDGDGVVGFSDTSAIAANYALTHLKGIGHSNAKVTGAPDLRFDLSGITPRAGQTITVPILLGSSTLPMDTIAGIAARIMIDGIVPPNPPTVSYNTSWMGTPGNTIRFSKGINANRLDWTYARNDNNNVAGGGIIASITFTIPFGSEGQNLKLYFDDVTIVDKLGKHITSFNTVDDSAAILSPLAVYAYTSSNQYLKISPNPSSGACVVHLSLPKTGTYEIAITEVSGKLVWKAGVKGKAGNQTVRLPTELLSAGMYLVHLRGEGLPTMTPVRLVRE